MSINWKKRLKKTAFKLWFWPLIWSLLGVFFVFEASIIVANKRFNNPYYYGQQQLIWLLLSLFVYFIGQKISWSFWKKTAPILFGANIVLLILVFFPFIGLKIGGAHRWLNLGLTTYQPSELLKLSFPLYLSVWLTKRKRNFSHFITLLSLPAGLILLEPDMGTLILIITTISLVYFIFSQKLKLFFKFAFFLSLISLFFILISPYRRQRLFTLLNPYQDRLGSSYQLNQIIISLGRGGLLGQGLGGSKERYLFLPASHTDAIFAVIGEEVGFIGSSLLLISYLIFFRQIFKISEEIEEIDKKIFLYSLGIFIFLQLLINIGGMVALLPLTGVPLPFISYGGSALITSWLMIAIGQSALKST